MQRTPRVLVSLLAAGSLFLLPSCSSGTEVSTTSGPSASVAPSAGATLGPEAFAAAIKRPGTVVLDVRTPAEYAAGHLPGAVNLDVEGQAFATRLRSLNPTTPYAVYCRSGNRSATALDLMRRAGFTAAYHLEGGIGAWESAGGDTTTD